MKAIHWFYLFALVVLILAYRTFGHLLGLKLPPIDMDGITINGLDWAAYVDHHYFSVGRRASEAMPKYIDQVLAQDATYMQELLAQSENKNLSYLILKEAIARAVERNAILRKPS